MRCAQAALMCILPLGLGAVSRLSVEDSQSGTKFIVNLIHYLSPVMPIPVRKGERIL